MPATRDAPSPAEQWNALVADQLTRWPPGVGKQTFVEHPPLRGPWSRGLHRLGIDRRVIALWPYTQVRHARSLLRLVTDDAEVDIAPPLLREYARGSAFAARPTSDQRYVDDNAWVALAQLQERWIHAPHAVTSERTERHLQWLAQFVDDDGGARWIEGGLSRHACSTGGVGVALALVPRGQVPGHEPDTSAQRIASNCADFLREILTDDTGLVRDNIDDHGRIEPTVWSYNQGLQVRLEIALHHRGDAHAWERAERSASAGLEHFAGDTLWNQPVIFNAIWFRGLVALAAAAPESPVARDALAALAQYAERLNAWLGTHPPFAAGVVEPGGPGRYERGESGVVDRAGALQISCLARMSAQQYSLVV